MICRTKKNLRRYTKIYTRDRTYLTKEGFVNLHQSRGTQSKAYGDVLKRKQFSKKVTGKSLRSIIELKKIRCTITHNLKQPQNSNCTKETIRNRVRRPQFNQINRHLLFKPKNNYYKSRHNR